MSTRIEQLEAQVNELLEWKRQREVQQLAYPLDLASKNALGAFVVEGPGSSPLQDGLSLTGNAQNIAVPKAYAQTVVVLIDNVRYELPSLI